MNHLATDRTVVVLSLFDSATRLVLFDDASFQATVAMSAETRQYLDAIQSSYQAALHTSLIEGLTPFETAVDIHQHVLQGRQVEATQAISQCVVAKAATGSDPSGQIGVGQISVQLLETGETKNKGVEQSKEDAG